MSKYNIARRHMVESQLAPNAVTAPRLLGAFTAIPREIFIPKAAQAGAYTDSTVPMGAGRFLLEPRVLARMIDALQVEPGAKILSLGGTSGYAAAILAYLGADVTDIEPDPQFDALYTAAMAALKCNRATRKSGDLRQGIPTPDGYHGILVQGAVDAIPYGLAHLLQRGGRLVAIVVENGAPTGQAVCLEKADNGHVSALPLFDAWAPYLPGCAPQPHFSFA